MTTRMLVWSLGLLLLMTAGTALADEGDSPSGPEACVVDAVNDRRGAGAMEWSGSIQDELRLHAIRMAAAGRLSHDDMDARVAGLPAGWNGYGEASAAHSLSGVDESAVESWCQEVARLFWESDPHRGILDDDSRDFVSAGVHWDGEKMWVAVGVFSAQGYQPASVRWPGSYTDGLEGGWKGSFYDDDGDLFESDIERLAAARITLGCNPPLFTRFCPEEAVSRGEMAAFIARAFGWQGGEGDRFIDDDGSVFEQEIEALAARGVTEGCDPPSNVRFCPDEPVTRGEMATFLGRALGLEPSSSDRFEDTDRSVHRRYINAVAEAGITMGCDPDGRKYCPTDSITRGQMAAFLVRAGLVD